MKGVMGVRAGGSAGQQQGGDLGDAEPDRRGVQRDVAGRAGGCGRAPQRLLARGAQPQEPPRRPPQAAGGPLLTPCSTPLAIMYK